MAAFAIYLVGLALVAVVAWLVARPFLVPLPLAPETEAAEPGHWEKRKEEALAAIRDAELDHSMGKLSDEDYRALRSRLEREAIGAIRTLEREEP